MSFQSISTDTLNHIFSYIEAKPLPLIRLVCNLFQKIISNIIEKAMCDDMIMYLFQFKSLSVPTLEAYLTNIKSIDIDNDKISYLMLAAFVSNNFGFVPKIIKYAADKLSVPYTKINLLAPLPVFTSNLEFIENPLFLNNAFFNLILPKDIFPIFELINFYDYFKSWIRTIFVTNRIDILYQMYPFAIGKKYEVVGYLYRSICIHACISICIH